MKNQYHLIALLLFFATIGARLAQLLSGSNIAMTIVFYIVMALGLIDIAIESFMRKQYADAYEFKNRFHLDLFSFVASIGFFVDFVYGAVSIYFSVDDKSYHNMAYFIPLCVACAVALLSSFYFIMVSASFNASNYDFRQLKGFGFAPLIWAISKALSALTQAVSFSQDSNIVLKYVVLAFCAFCFYAMLFETENDAGAKPLSVFCIRATYFSGVVYAIDQFMLMFASGDDYVVENGIFAITVLFICAFLFFFEKNILSHTEVGV